MISLSISIRAALTGTGEFRLAQTHKKFKLSKKKIGLYGICSGRSESLLSTVMEFEQDDQGYCLVLYGYLCRMIRVTAGASRSESLLSAVWVYVQAVLLLASHIMDTGSVDLDQILPNIPA